MKADVEVSEYSTVIGVEGKDIEEIKNKVALAHGFNEYGKSLFKVINIR